MNPNTETKTEQTAFLDDIEKRVSEIFSAQMTEVEQCLVEKINHEKEEAQRRIEAVNKEFAQVRGVLEEHKVVMAELQAAETRLRGTIRGHFERAVNYQKMMENAATLAGDELEKIGGLNQELEKIRVKAQAEYDGLKKQLADYAGIVAKLPAPARKAAGDVDWSEELVKLRKVRDLLATLRQSEPYPAAPSEAVDATATTAAASAVEELAVSLGLIGPEDDSVRDDIDFTENDPALAEIPDVLVGDLAASSGPSEEPREEAAGVAAGPEAAPAKTAVSEADLDSLCEALARYRKAEPVNNGFEVGFYIAEAASVLDAESFMAAVGKIVEGARQLHAQLTHTTSVKDLFLLKQEILNQQEILRKLFFRIVRFCDKENGRLPEPLGEIISSQGMKEVIERLTMANWSDPTDFEPFLNELEAMRRAFETRSAASPRYLKTVLDVIEGREN